MLVEFDEVVTLSSLLVQLELVIGTRTRQASAPGTARRGLASVPFEYLVQAADLDGDGISIPANALDGTITASTRQAAAADLSHEAVAPDPSRRVDGSIVVTPKVTSVTIGSRPRRAGDGDGLPVYGDTYQLGEEIQVNVEFDKPVRRTGTPQVALVIGGHTKRTSYTGRVSRAPSTVFFYYVVQPGDLDGNGVGIPANALTLNGGTITMAGHAATAADLTHDAVASEQMVAGSAAAAPRVLYGLQFSTTNPVNFEAFGRGESVQVSIYLDRRVEVRGNPRVALQIGTRTRQANYRETYARYGTVILFFEYVVQAEDMDSDGIGFPANAVSFNGGAITLEGDATVAADLTHDAVEVLSGNSYKVDGSTVGTPRVSLVAQDWPPSSGGSYGLGETIHSPGLFSWRSAGVGQAPTGASGRWAHEASLLRRPLFQLWLLPIPGAGGGS